MSKKHPVLWPAKPHTIAKIEILKGYLKAWLRILGSTRRGQVILYVDGFAGPGRYVNHREGSPIAALEVARNTFFSMKAAFVAGKIECAFIESDLDRHGILCESVVPFQKIPGLGITTLCEEFTEGIAQLRKKFPGSFSGKGPLFIFADPFGGTGIPFQTFAQCMQANTAELLINLDADGIGRIFAASNNNKREEQLTELFGDDSWKTALTAGSDLKSLCVQILDLYKLRLRSLPGGVLIWTFAMRSKDNTLNYHLVFATRHRLGLEKMKEAMKAIDQTGSYSFSDAHAGQILLFRDDDEVQFAGRLFSNFDGQTITLEQADTFALTETPFLNAKAMLAILEKQQRLQVETVKGHKRRANTYPDGKVAALRFGQFTTRCEHPNLF